MFKKIIYSFFFFDYFKFVPLSSPRFSIAKQALIIKAIESN